MHLHGNFPKRGILLPPSIYIYVCGACGSGLSINPI
jgi:hypothetical protein